MTMKFETLKKFLPPRAPERPRFLLQIRCSEEQKAEWKEAAHQEFMNTSEYFRCLHLAYQAAKHPQPEPPPGPTKETVNDW